jgi:FAD/FMN-containing dehydrogenase
MSSRNIRPAVRRVTPEAVATLEEAISGNVVLPSDPGYDKARQLSDPAFERFPAVVIFCETPSDVRAALAFAAGNDLPVTCRSSGHNTAGFSVGDDAMVIDTSRIRYVHVAERAGEPVARVGAGSDWGFVGRELDQHGLHVPGGGCESVCVAGYMQGGGYSYTSRMYGMNCDNVAEVKVMLADGRIVVANERQNVPLFWAIRGGTGNNFGVLLEVTYRLHRTGPLWGFSIRWPIEDAPQAIVEIQSNLMETNPSRRIGFETHGAPIDGRQVLLMRGMYRGNQGEAIEALYPVLTTRGATLEYGFEGSYFDLNQRHEHGVGAPPEAKEAKQSGYLRAPLTLSEWEGVIEMFARTPNPYSVFNLEAYGAAINDIAAGSNAFVHRDAYCNLFLDVFWIKDSDKAAAVAFLDDFMAMMGPYFDRPDGRPQSNQNYPRATQDNYMELYFDGFIKDLVAVKRLYDPTNTFRYEQSIPLDYSKDARVDPASPRFTGTEAIVPAPL